MFILRINSIYFIDSLIDLGRKENIVDINEPESNITLKALAQQLRPDACKVFNKQLDAQTDAVEVAEDQVRLEVTSQDTEDTSLRATLTSSPESGQRLSMQKPNSKTRSDALIVAALMGNSSGFSSNINSIINEKKQQKQRVTSPPQLTISPVFQGDSLSHRSMSLFNDPKVKANAKRASHMEMSVTNSNVTDMNQGVVIASTLLDANNMNNNNNTSSKSNLRVPAGTSRASKRMLNFCLT